MRNSVYFESTNRIVRSREEALAIESGDHADFPCAGEGCFIVRDNTVLRAVEMPNRRMIDKSIYKYGNPSDGFDRNNAVGDVPDLATGYQIAIDTLTYIKKKTTDQKFYKEAPADYMPIVVGEGAFSKQLLTNRTYLLGGDFEQGIIKTGTAGARLSSANIAIDGVLNEIANWAEQIGYTIFDVEQALRANNWDIIEKMHKARKEVFDLGIQKTMFLGVSTQQSAFPGLLTNPNITTNTSRITKLINTMDASELQAFVTGFIDDYWVNTNATALPNRLVIPYAEWLGDPSLTVGTVGTFPVPLIEYLQNAFSRAVSRMEKKFEIMPSAYCDAVNNPAGKNYYLLFRADEESGRGDLPVPYTTTQPNSLDNFHLQDVGYGQFTGFNVFRNLEFLRFQF